MPAIAFGLGILFVFLFAELGYLAAIYVVTYLAYQRLARVRGLQRPWLAWIPVANSYLIGKIADDIHAQYCKATRRRVIVLIANAANIVFLISYLAGSLLFFLEYLSVSSGPDFPDPWFFPLLSGSQSLLVLIPFLLMTVSSVVYAVFLFLSWNTVFREYAPEKASNYLIFSLLFYFLLSAPFAGPAVILVIHTHTPQFELLNQPRACTQQPYGSPPQQQNFWR